MYFQEMCVNVRQYVWCKQGIYGMIEKITTSFAGEIHVRRYYYRYYT